MSGMGGGSTDAALALIALMADPESFKSKLEEFKTREEAATKAEAAARLAIVDMQVLKEQHDAKVAEFTDTQTRFHAHHLNETARLGALETALNQRTSGHAQSSSELQAKVDEFTRTSTATAEALRIRESAVGGVEQRIAAARADLATREANLATRIQKMREAMP